MTIYTCAPNWDAMLTCIYEAFESRLGHNNLMLMLEPVKEYTLFDEYIHIDTDINKAAKVSAAINNKISPYVYHQLLTASMAYEEDVLDNIYHVLILGFKYGGDVLNMLQYRDIMRNYEIRKRVSREACRFQEIVRFHQLNDLYICHIEPKSRIASYLGPIFADRMPSENFMIIDDIHLEAVVHPKDQDYYMQILTKDELTALLNTEQINDKYTDLWKIFFDTIAIKERTNPTCQNTHFPKWARIHAVEFQ